MSLATSRDASRQKRHARLRLTLTGSADRPRLAVFRSSMHIYAQLVDDLTGRTLASSSSILPDFRAQVKYGGNVKAAKLVGAKLAEAAKQAGISKVAFDRRHYKYHGRVKALAEGAREGGLQF